IAKAGLGFICISGIIYSDTYINPSVVIQYHIKGTIIAPSSSYDPAPAVHPVTSKGSDDDITARRTNTVIGYGVSVHVGASRSNRTQKVIVVVFVCYYVPYQLCSETITKYSFLFIGYFSASPSAFCPLPLVVLGL